MRITADTNVLVRAAVWDDPKQAALAAQALKDAEVVAIALPCLCEFFWVLRRLYGFSVSDAAGALRALMAVPNVEMNRPAVAAGLALAEAGGDFADGVIAFEGRWLGGETFVSFDRKAVALLQARGQSAQLLA